MSENKPINIRKIMYNEVSLVIGLVAMVSGFIFWVQNPQDELQYQIIKLESRIESSETVTIALEKIKNNDLHEMQLRMEQLETRQIEILQAVSGIESLLKRTH